ncbi:hypothetical protein [Actinoplanes sp. NPDC023714]|uniref:hypothetical protein n=1 Tax=Actinoplanes sp. NPDC023714 TaxID=3154322 RepID=UPI00340A89D4
MKRRDGGCGCGCGGGCGERQPGATAAGTFTRPRFFAGQLLTEEDLEALGDYLTAKNRLHNRYLVGAGVVCGLEVLCADAGGSRIRVRPGYALDCCGNDIVVGCDETLDVTALLADLPHVGGCVEPCPAEPEPGKGDAGKEPLARRYELVVEYTETPGRLVAPYAGSEEQGSSADCEPSRVSEGYRFALRCRCRGEKERPSLWTALAACETAGLDAAGLEARLRAAGDAAQQLTSGAARSPDGAPAEKEIEEARREFDAEKKLPQAVRLASIGARLALAGDRTAARDVLTQVEDTFTGQEQQDPIAAILKAALLEQVSSLRRRIPPPKPTTDEAGIAPTTADRLLANGVPASEEMREKLREIVAEGRDVLLTRRAGQPGTRCQDDTRLARLTVDRRDDRALQAAAELVLAAFGRSARECACAAANPPCPSCTDTAVPLAEIVVEGCEVVRVCDSIRRHAVTGSTLGYWLPMDLLHDEIVQACCDDAPGRKLPLLSVLNNVRKSLTPSGRTQEKSVEPQKQLARTRLNPRQAQQIKKIAGEAENLKGELAQLQTELSRLVESLNAGDRS